MRIRSPLADLTGVLEQIRDSAALYSETLSQNESSTRAVLIDPLLRTLGWDTGNPFMVEVEKTINQGRADYALYDYGQEDIKIIIEAKKLGADLYDTDTFLALVKYAFSAGVRDIFLTDGIVWHHHTAFEPGKQTPEKILDLRSGNLVELATYFVQSLDAAKYWPQESDVDELSQTINQLTSQISGLQLEFGKLKETTQGQPKSKEIADTSVSPQTESEPSLGDMVHLDRVENATGTKPSELRLADGTIIGVGSWRDVLIQCCTYVLENNQNLPVPMKDVAGKKVNLLSPVRPPRGVSYFETVYRGQPLFLHTNYSADNCVRNAVYILDRLDSSIKPNPTAVRYG